jgi:hypothetical protein
MNPIMVSPNPRIHGYHTIDATFICGPIERHENQVEITKMKVSVQHYDQGWSLHFSVLTAGACQVPTGLCLRGVGDLSFHPPQCDLQR